MKKVLILLVTSTLLLVVCSLLWLFLSVNSFSSHDSVSDPNLGLLRDVAGLFTFEEDADLSGWDEKKLARKRTKYSIAEKDGNKVLKAHSVDSASALFFETKLSKSETPFLGWKWLAEKFPSRTSIESIKDKEEFDFVAQVYVIFNHKSFLSAKAIQYVWAENIPVGTYADSPYTKNVKILVVESGMQKTWKKVMRNIKEDYLMLFGSLPKKDVTAISFMSDADSTSSESIAYFDDISYGYFKDRELVHDKNDIPLIVEDWETMFSKKYPELGIKYPFLVKITRYIYKISKLLVKENNVEKKE